MAETGSAAEARASLQQRLMDGVGKALAGDEQVMAEIKTLKHVSQLGEKNVDLERLLRNRVERASLLAVRLLIMEDFEPLEATLPEEAPVAWNGRLDAADIASSPIDFMEKYYGKFLNAGVLDQSSLRRLDDPLFEAVRTFCRSRGLDPRTYLPPPARTHTPAVEKIHPPNSAAKASRPAPAPSRNTSRVKTPEPI